MDKGIEYHEPWRKLLPGQYAPPEEGYFVQHREVIKNRVDAPHLAICMPIGPKTDEVTGEDGNVFDKYRSPGLVPMELMMNYMQVTQPLGVSLSWLMMKNDLSAKLREEMTKKCIEQGVNYVFYWDDDVLIPPNTLYRMLTHMATNPDVGAITGVYFTKMVPTEPILYKQPGIGAYWGFNDDPTAPLEDVYSAGAGCLMARMDAIKMMNPPYWEDERTGNVDGSKQGIIGHDVRFFRKMREESGYRTCVDGALQCHHVDIKNQKIYALPDNRPNYKTAREMAARHANISPADQEEANRMSTAEEIEAELEV